MPELYPRPIAQYPGQQAQADNTDPARFIAYGHHRRWCIVSDKPATPVGDEHPPHCASWSVAAPDAHDDEGRLHIGTVSLAAPYLHGVYPTPRPRTDLGTYVRMELWHLTDEQSGDEVGTSLNITTEGARSLAAKLIALADKADGIDRL